MKQLRKIVWCLFLLSSACTAVGVIMLAFKMHPVAGLLSCTATLGYLYLLMREGR